MNAREKRIDKYVKSGLPLHLAELLGQHKPQTAKQREASRKNMIRMRIEWEHNPNENTELHCAVFRSNIINAMEDAGITESQLASRIGKSRQYVHSMLKGGRRSNFSIETMVKLTIAVGLKLRIIYENLEPLPRKSRHPSPKASAPTPTGRQASGAK